MDIVFLKLISKLYTKSILSIKITAYGDKSSSHCTSHDVLIPVLNISHSFLTSLNDTGVPKAWAYDVCMSGIRFDIRFAAKLAV